MAELMDVLDAFSTPLKIAWVVWAAWGIAQVYWYRYERRPQASARTAPVRKPFVSKPSTPERVGTRLVTPEQMIVKHPPAAVASQMVEAAPSLIDGPGEIGELDRFVADFEMNTRQRRGHPHNGESFDTHAQQ